MDDKEVLILNMLKEAYPDLDAGSGTPFYELVVRPMVFLWTRHAEGSAELKDANVLENFRTMNPADLDRLMTRFFETRKQGNLVYATVRIVFKNLRDYYIPQGMVILTADNRQYTTISDAYYSQMELPGTEALGYTIDVSVVSDGVGNSYNLSINDPMTVSDALSIYVIKAFVVQDSSNGGVIESNLDFYMRVKSGLTLKNLTTYRAIRGVLSEQFNISEVVPIGLRDPELRRDLVELPGAGIIHRGGMADFYVRAEPYTIVQGYRCPLGFPYAFNGKTMETDPDGLMADWNNQDFHNVDIYNRGSMLEVVPNLSPLANMMTLTSNIQPIHDYSTHTDHEALHSNNLVKQMWPLVVKVGLKVSDARGQAAVDIVKSAIVTYIMGLRGSVAPKVSEVGHAIRNAGVSIVHLPISLECYYLTENLDMQKIGLNKVRVPATSVLKPLEADGLKFALDDDTQISIRTCMFYSNVGLIDVEVI